MIKWKVRTLAEAKGLNIGQFADRAGIAYSSALDFWHGRARRVSLEVMNRLCNALACGPSDLFEFTPGDMDDELGSPKEEDPATTDLSAGLPTVDRVAA